MNITKLTNDTVRHFIPNVMCEVEGETPLFDKLEPFIQSAKTWIESEFLGPDEFLREAHNDFAIKILVTKAFADAVPSLDLVVTPNGMAVINTDNLAPASKERVERLVSSLRSYVSANLRLLVDICRTYPQWRQSDRGRYFCATFLSLHDCEDFSDTVYCSYDRRRGRCLVIEREMAERYIGHSLMSKLHADHDAGIIKEGSDIFGSLHSALITLLEESEKTGHTHFLPDLLWKACRPVIYMISLYPEYYSVWREEMGDKFNTPGFVNDIKGGFYF